MAISDHYGTFFAQVHDAVQEVRQRTAEAVVRGGHGQDVTVVAVTKTHGPEAVEAAYEAGLRDVGENKVQEAEGKMSHVSVPVRWHLIGHLQRNKVRSALGFNVFHALDSERLAVAIQDALVKADQRLDVLVQVNVSGETSKGGIALGSVSKFAERLHDLSRLNVRGVMTMAPFDADEKTLRSVFAGARVAGERLRDAGHSALWLSMGMSGDYEIAVEEGATHIRLGTVLFGGRT